MPRLYHEGDWVRLAEPVRGATMDGIARDLQRGMEGLVIIAPEDAHHGSQVVEFPVDVLGADGTVGDVPLYVEADLRDEQLEPVRRI